ncbi:protein translocase subunit SecF [Geminicoccaceae bacterium 1502E]|nr:protein translocase subunit SecF [Geminicoccaceae bacterium 1502E]
MRLPRLVRDDTTVPFFRFRMPAFALSAAVIILAVVLLFAKGLNFGIDFKGGTLMDVRTPGVADLSAMRTTLGGLGLGEVALQEAGEPDEVLIRIERQRGDEEAQQAAVGEVKAALEQLAGPGIEYRRTEFVGPKVGEELREAGIFSVLIATALVMVYLWFRFEWQYGVAALAALTHDVFATLLVFSLLGLEFNLSIIAAILTIVGYSLNDTVVVFDRVRENLRRYKSMKLDALLDRSLNETLARTVMTSLTTLLALFALYFFGGEVIEGFTFAMIFGVFVGTYSTLYISTPLLYYLKLRAEPEAAAGEPAGAR